MFIAICTFTQRATNAAVVNIWLAAGQSNMVGQGRVEDLPSSVALEYPEILYTHRSGSSTEPLGPLQPRLRRDGAFRRWYGPEYTFGARLASEETKHAIIKFAENGSSLHSDWEEDSPLRNEFFNFADAAIQEIQNMGHIPRIAGVLWGQGAGDSNLQEPAEAYADNLSNLTSGIRGYFNSSELPFFFSKIHKNVAGRPFASVVSQQQEIYAASDPFASLVQVDDLILTDTVHFSSNSLQTLGFRFADLAISVTPVPEPSSCIAIVFTSIFLSRRKRRKALC